MALDFEGRFGTIRQAAPAAGERVSRRKPPRAATSCTACAAICATSSSSVTSFQRRNKLKRTARSSSGGSLTLKVGILLVLFVSEVFSQRLLLGEREGELGVPGVGPWKPSRSPCSTSGGELPDRRRRGYGSSITAIIFASCSG